MVEQWNSDGGTVEECLWKSVVEQWNSVMEMWNSVGGIVEQ